MNLPTFINWSELWELVKVEVSKYVNIPSSLDAVKDVILSHQENLMTHSITCNGQGW